MKGDMGYDTEWKAGAGPCYDPVIVAVLGFAGLPMQVGEQLRRDPILDFLSR